MARPRTNGPADRFTTSEAAVVGAGLTARAVVAVQAIGFAPEPLSRAEGRSGSVAYDADGVAHWALIGALRLAGIPLLAAARLGYAVADELGAAYGRLPSGIDRYLGRSHNPGPRYFPWGNAPQDKFILIDRSRDFWLHHLLRTRTNIYKVGEVLDGDFCVEIVNSEYVFTGFHWKQPLAIKSPFGGASSYPSPEY